MSLIEKDLDKVCLIEKDTQGLDKVCLIEKDIQRLGQSLLD